MRTQKRKRELRQSLYLEALGINHLSRERQKAVDEGRVVDAMNYQKELSEIMAKFQNDLCIAFDYYIGHNDLKD